MAEVLVLAELDAEGALKKVTSELITAARAVQKIYAVSEVAQQRQFKTTQGGFGRAGCASQRLDTVQIIEEKFREAGLMFKNA